MRLVAPRGSTARNVQIAAVVFAGGLLLLAATDWVSILGHAGHTRREVLVGSLALACAGLALRHRAPLTGLGLGVAAFAADVTSGGTLATTLVFTQVLYESCVHGPAWLWRWALRISVGLTVVAAVVAPLALRSWRGAAVAVAPALILVLPVVTAISVRQYRDQAAADRARAEQTARLAELDRRQAVVAERTRMARELHDVIANHLSAVAIHASALLSVKNLEPAAAERALRVIRENGVQGLAEMRQMIGLLRDPSGGAAPEVESPTTARLAEAGRLVAQARDAGLDVDLTVAGQPRPLPVNVDLAGYRIVQESLTNALRHGCGRATARIEYGPDRVVLTITNPAPPGSPVGAAAGHGLIGMRERAELLGGCFGAGREDDTWRVRAELPAREAAA